MRRGELYAQKARLDRDKLTPQKKAKEDMECDQQRQERFRQILGLGGPHWNNFEKRWEGAEEMTEKEEVENLVRAELRRRKAARAAAAQQPASPEKAVGPQINTDAHR